MLKVIETHTKFDEDYKAYSIEIKRDEKCLAGIDASDYLSQSPEDATLGRDLNCVFSAINFFTIAYEAGKSGEEVTFEEIFLDDEDNEISEEEYYS